MNFLDYNEEQLMKEFGNRTTLLHLVGIRDGFMNTGGCVCPYCFESFASVIRTGVLRELREERRQGGAKAPWE